MDHELDNGTSDFRDQIAQVPEVKVVLPLVHSTDTYNLRTILREGIIQPQNCDVFKGEMLTYMFYGRPPTDRILKQNQQHRQMPFQFVLF